MSEITVTFIEASGAEKVITNAEVGESMMEVARDNGVEGILGDCGGGCACATCHVYVDPQWESIVGAPDEVEEMTLDMVDEDIRQPNSRLCCQISLTEAMNGLKVTVGPEQF